jgi:hypothetical protein
MSEVRGLLERFTRALRDTNVPFMLAGSFASTAHGVPRATQDIDIIIDPTRETLDRLLAVLPTDTYYVDADAAREALRTRTMFNVIDVVTGWKIDLIVRKNRAFSKQEFERRRLVSILGVEAYVASAEDTVIAKLEWSALGGGSERQRRDVAGVLATLGDELDRAYILRWVEELGLTDEWAAAQRTPLS